MTVRFSGDVNLLIDDSPASQEAKNKIKQIVQQLQKSGEVRFTSLSASGNGVPSVIFHGSFMVSGLEAIKQLAQFLDS